MLLILYDFIAGISQIFEPNSCLALEMVTKFAVTLRGYSVLSCMIEHGMDQDAELPHCIIIIIVIILLLLSLFDALF
jgi:hypothetical protein